MCGPTSRFSVTQESCFEVIEIGAPAASSVLKQELFEAKPNAVAKVLESGQDVSMRGATQTVLALAESGVPMGVVTNSGAPEVWLEAAGVLELMKVLVTRNDVSLPKPSPEGYLLAAKRLDVSPAECIAFEDSHDGWLAATRAGMRVVVVATTRPAWAETDTELVPTLDRAAVLALGLPVKVEDHV
jgi:HAD superfamily hydrolase (TIGR01509 family)